MYQSVLSKYLWRPLSEENPFNPFIAALVGEGEAGLYSRGVERGGRAKLSGSKPDQLARFVRISHVLTCINNSHSSKYTD